jgi:lysophospholipase L1-like esterase
VRNPPPDVAVTPIPDDPPAFDYSNLSQRPSGPFLRIAARLVPGVQSVQDQVAPYAEAWRVANQAAWTGDPATPLWVALGDSMTLGIGASAFDRGWVGQVAERLTEAGHPHRVVNLGVSGARTPDILERQLPVLAQLARPPALVTVLIGSNDLMRASYREQLAPAFTDLLDRLPAGSVIATLPQPRAAAAAVNRLLESAVLERSMVIAEMRQTPPGSWRGKLAADHFHPNDLGYAGMAEVFYRAITQQASSEPNA